MCLRINFRTTILEMQYASSDIPEALLFKKKQGYLHHLYVLEVLEKTVRHEKETGLKFNFFFIFLEGKLLNGSGNPCFRIITVTNGVRY